MQSEVPMQSPVNIIKLQLREDREKEVSCELARFGVGSFLDRVADLNRYPRNN
jgi:hypothetical protein